MCAPAELDSMHEYDASAPGSRRAATDHDWPWSIERQTVKLVRAVDEPGPEYQSSLLALMYLTEPKQFGDTSAVTFRSCDHSSPDESEWLTD